MRNPHLLVLLGLAACIVPDKLDTSTDGGLSPDAATNDHPGAPETTLTDAPAAASRDGHPTFAFTADEPATFTCSIDGESPVSCTSPYTRALGDGPHTFSVRAIDLGGNQDDTPAEHLWRIDTVAPDTSITHAPPTTDNSVNVTFDFAASEAGATFTCSLDSTAYLPCHSGDTFGPMGEGAHSFAVRAADVAGNVDPTPAVYAWSVDTTMPDTQIVSGPMGATSSTSATFSFVSPDAGAGATYKCSIDGLAFVPCTSPRTYSNLAEADHTFAVRVRDAVGNTDPTPATRAWTVDLTPPDTMITSGPSGSVPLASASFEFTSDETGATFECDLDAAGFAACTSPQTFSGLPQGSHTFSVRATDAAGHRDTSPASQTWTVDTVAPTLMITSGPGQGSTTGPYVSFAFTSDGTVTCSLDGGPFVACASPDARNLPAGAHGFHIRAMDAAGNQANASRAWTIACAAESASPGAAGLFHLDEGTGSTAASAVAAPDAILETPAWLASARFGGGLGFTATDRLHWPAGLGAAGDVSIELWARPEAASGGLVASGDGRLALRVVGGTDTIRFFFAMVDSDGASHSVMSAPVAPAAWHHVLATFAAPALHLWVDGVRVDGGGAIPGTAPSLDSVEVGGFTGDLDDLYLTQSAIATDADALPRYCPN